MTESDKLAEVLREIVSNEEHCIGIGLEPCHELDAARAALAAYDAAAQMRQAKEQIFRRAVLCRHGLEDPNRLAEEIDRYDAARDKAEAKP